MLAAANPHFLDSTSGQYRPLSKLRIQIRLLIVEPGLGSDIVCGWLQHATLEHECLPAYETVSYCWGDPKIQDRMLVDGYLVNVPASSTAALRKMRRPDKSRTLWIDSVCINQSDLLERSAQVSAMDLVYSMADANLIYLGADEGDCSEGALKTLEGMIERIDEEIAKPSTGTVDRRLYTKFGSVSDDLVARLALSESEYESLLPLYELPWFQRLWVLQEMALALRNLCFWGDTIFRLESALKLSPFLIGTGFGSPSGIRPVRSMLHLSRNVPHDFHVARQFNDLRSQDTLTTEPRDRIFALLGLFRRRRSLQKIPALLTPDYEKPVALVFRDATRFVLNETATRRDTTDDLLEEVRHRSEADITANGVTSWTIKWDRRFDPKLDAMEFVCFGYSSYKAGIPPHRQKSREHESSIAHPVDMDVLTLKGFMVGEIDWSSPPIRRGRLDEPNERDSADTDLELHLDTVADVLTILDSVVSAVADGPYDCADVYSVAAEILTAGSNETYRRFPVFGPAEYRKVDGFKELTRCLRHTATFPLDVDEIPRPEEIPYDSLVGSMFHEIFGYVLPHRRLFKCNTGHVGIGPKILRQGDRLAAIHGKFPLFVLRPLGREYQLIGSAVVPGMMHGEVFNMGLPSVWIDIR